MSKMFNNGIAKGKTLVLNMRGLSSVIVRAVSLCSSEQSHSYCHNVLSLPHGVILLSNAMTQ